jgi:hypothetical protein
LIVAADCISIQEVVVMLSGEILRVIYGVNQPVNQFIVYDLERSSARSADGCAGCCRQLEINRLRSLKVCVITNQYWEGLTRLACKEKNKPGSKREISFLSSSSITYKVINCGGQGVRASPRDSYIRLHGSF